MKKRSRRVMWILVVVVIIAAVVVFFRVPYSKLASEFSGIVDGRISDTEKQADVFEEKDLEGLPMPVQNYFRYCGWLGTPKMSYMKASFADVDFIMSAEKTIKIDYVQYNFVEKPDRFALIKSSMFGVPFEGFDSYNNGVGSMKGVFAKVIPLFDQRGADMNRACLATILAECFLVPNVALQDYIEWEEIDDTHAKATISYYGISAGGVFTFDENGAVLSFKTSDRAAVDMNGSVREADWSAVYSDYQTVDGIKLPRVLKSIWHYPEGDSIYFNENEVGVVIEYY